MIEAGDLTTGVTLKLDNSLFKVIKTAYNKPGRGKASMETTLMDIKTGRTVNRIFGVEERLDNIYVEAEMVDYLYSDGVMLHFMNPQSYEQHEAAADLFGDDAKFLKEGLQIELRIHEGIAIDYKLPTTATYKVTDADVAVAGDTTGKVMKKCTVETGFTVAVPLFVKIGDVIVVDTRDGSYTGRG